MLGCAALSANLRAVGAALPANLRGQDRSYSIVYCNDWVNCPRPSPEGQSRLESGAAED